MKKLLFFASMALFASCATTHKHGCGLSVKNETETTRIVVRNTIKNGKLTQDSILIKERMVDEQKLIFTMMINYHPKVSVCRGYGKVVVLDTFYHPESYLIRIGGVLMRDDVNITPVKYLIVYQSDFFNSLNQYVNTDTDVYFESNVVFAGDTCEMQVTNNGCIDHVDYPATPAEKRKDIIFVNFKN